MVYNFLVYDANNTFPDGKRGFIYVKDALKYKSEKTSRCISKYSGFLNSFIDGRIRYNSKDNLLKILIKEVEISELESATSKEQWLDFINNLENFEIDYKYVEYFDGPIKFVLYEVRKPTSSELAIIAEYEEKIKAVKLNVLQELEYNKYLQLKAKYEK